MNTSPSPHRSRPPPLHYRHRNAHAFFAEHTFYRTIRGRVILHHFSFFFLAAQKRRRLIPTQRTTHGRTHFVMAQNSWCECLMTILIHASGIRLIITHRRSNSGTTDSTRQAARHTISFWIFQYYHHGAAVRRFTLKEKGQMLLWADTLFTRTLMINSLLIILDYFLISRSSDTFHLLTLLIHLLINYLIEPNYSADGRLHYERRNTDAARRRVVLKTFTTRHGAAIWSARRGSARRTNRRTHAGRSAARAVNILISSTVLMITDLLLLLHLILFIYNSTIAHLILLMLSSWWYAHRRGRLITNLTNDDNWADTDWWRLLYFI